MSSTLIFLHRIARNGDLLESEGSGLICSVEKTSK